MAWLTVNSKNVFGASVQEAGTYNVKIVRSEVNKSGRGNQYISIDYQVLDGKYKGGEIRYQNLTWDDNDIETSQKRFNTLLTAIGIPDGTDVPSIEACANGLIGKQLSIDVNWAEPNNKGNIYLEVRGYHKLSQEGSQPNGVKRPNTGQASTGKSSNAPLPSDSDDPFANSNDTVDVKDSDLPF